MRVENGLRMLVEERQALEDVVHHVRDPVPDGAVPPNDQGVEKREPEGVEPTIESSCPSVAAYGISAVEMLMPAVL